MGVFQAGVGVFMFLSVGAIALFSFIAVASWADARRKERESYYKSETLKKLSESQGPAAVLELLREEQKIAAAKRKEGLRLGGLINIAVGVGLMIFLAGMVRDERAYLLGVIPLLIGVALLWYSLFFAPKE